MRLRTKVWLAGSGVFVLGTSVLGGYYYFSNKGLSIREILKNSKFISTLSGDAKTKQGEAEFDSDSENIRNSIPELKDVKDSIEGGRKLEAWCSKQMELDSGSNSKTLDLVKKYCLIRSISSQLSRNGMTLLGAGDEDQWEDTYGQRQTQDDNRADIGLSGNGGDVQNTDQDLLEVQNLCASNGKKDFLALDNNDLYTKTLKGCTEEGAVEI